MVPAWPIIGLLVVWFAASAVVQIRTAPFRRLRRLDPLGLLPRWNLFSPRPIRSDLVVRYRCWNVALQPLDWQTLPYPGERRLTDGIFSRQRRAKRTIYAQAERVTAVYRAHHDRPRKVITSPAYQHLLAVTGNAARNTPAAEPPRGVQFQVIRVYRGSGTAEVQPLFRSAVHGL